MFRDAFNHMSTDISNGILFAGLFAVAMYCTVMTFAFTWMSLKESVANLKQAWADRHVRREFRS